MATESRDETVPPVEEQSTPVEDEPTEVTKRSIRVEVWQTMKYEKLSTAMPKRQISLFNRIPNFNGASTAAKLLAETEEFKNAKNVMVNIDISQEQVKLEVIGAHKTLFVSATQKTPFVYAKIKNCNPDEVDAAAQKKIIKLLGPEDTYDEIDTSGVEKMDMIVVGSVAVSRLGHRIGKGNGYVDLDFAILTHLGVITKDTLIATTVHDVQLYDTLPENLFQSYDLPLDLIVTPSKVIRVSKRLQRPTGIQWKLLSSRRLEIVPVLKVIKEQEETNGKVIELKSEDTDIESFQQKARQKRGFRRNQDNRRRRRSGRTNSEKAQNGVDSHDEGEGGEKSGDGEGPKQAVRRQRKNRPFRSGPRRSTKDTGESGADKSEGEDNRSGTEKNGGDADGKKDGRRRKERHPKTERKRHRVERDVCIRISNISRSIRVKELKQELRNRNCNPIFITWNGFHGKCYLHFPKKPEQNDEEAGAELLKQLEDLTLTVQPHAKEGGEAKQVTLTCEIMKRKEGDAEEAAPPPPTNGNVLEGSRIETTDVTAV